MWYGKRDISLGVWQMLMRLPEPTHPCKEKKSTTTTTKKKKGKPGT
jgi:hypothetical protein